MTYGVKKILFLIVASLTILASCSTQQQPAVDYQLADLDATLPLPIQSPVVIYIPQSALDYWFYNEESNLLGKPGYHIGRGVATAFDAYFSQYQFISHVEQNDASYAVAFIVRPDWLFENKKLTLTFDYRAVDSTGKELHSASTSRELKDINLRKSLAFHGAAMAMSQQMIVDTYNAVISAGHHTEVTALVRDLDPRLLVDETEPVKTGTAFFINEHGDLLTAAHVVRGCMLVKVTHDDTVYDSDIIASSELLDIAVLNVDDAASADFLPLRLDVSMMLGEPVTVAGFPLDGLLESSPNLTLGNISSHRGLPGWQGSFQFTAPIQPGSSGSPIISDSGELLGVVTGTLSVTALIERGVVPQNVNFGLHAKYIKKFGDSGNIRFVYVDQDSRPSNVSATNEKAIKIIAKVACYQ